MQWKIDPSHTSLEMSVKHMGFFTVRGSFDQVSGTIEASDDGKLQRVEATIDAASINTRASTPRTRTETPICAPPTSWTSSAIRN